MDPMDLMDENIELPDHMATILGLPTHVKGHIMDMLDAIEQDASARTTPIQVEDVQYVAMVALATGVNVGQSIGPAPDDSGSVYDDLPPELQDTLDELASWVQDRPEVEDVVIAMAETFQEMGYDRRPMPDEAFLIMVSTVARAAYLIASGVKVEIKRDSPTTILA